MELDTRVSVEREYTSKLSKARAFLACSGGTVAGLEILSGREAGAKGKQVYLLPLLSAISHH